MRNVRLFALRLPSSAKRPSSVNWPTRNPDCRSARACRLCGAGEHLQLGDAFSRGWMGRKEIGDTAPVRGERIYLGERRGSGRDVHGNLPGGNIQLLKSAREHEGLT